MKNKKYLKSAISIGVGVILLTTAVFANYESASGYSSCKNALKKVAFAENLSTDFTMEITLDGDTLLKTFGSYKLAAGENPSVQFESTEEYDDNSYFSRRTVQDELEIYELYHSQANENYRGYIHNKYRDGTSLATDIMNDEETGEKMVFWMETIADALVGDLKNSFVLVSSEGGTSKYNISLTKDQMPSYVTAGVSLFTTAIRNNNTMTINGEEQSEKEPYYSLFGTGEPFVRDVTADMSVDDNGNPVQITGVVNIVGYDIRGSEHIMACSLSMDFYDFGSTRIERVSDETIAGLKDFRPEVVNEKVAENREQTEVVEETTSFPADSGEAVSVGVIGGADGPTAIYVD